jgi:phosphomannomutase
VIDHAPSNSIILELGNSWIAIRKSGTEPKIKYYSELITENKTIDAEKELSLRMETVCNELLSPKKYNLIPK